MMDEDSDGSVNSRDSGFLSSLYPVNEIYDNDADGETDCEQEGTRKIVPFAQNDDDDDDASFAP